MVLILQKKNCKPEERTVRNYKYVYCFFNQIRLSIEDVLRLVKNGGYKCPINLKPKFRFQARFSIQ